VWDVSRHNLGKLDHEDEVKVGEESENVVKAGVVEHPVASVVGGGVANDDALPHHGAAPLFNERVGANPFIREGFTDWVTWWEV
jgi:hypothetical protein